uniref:Alpha-soluble NSF attachment protein n=1 Tax=Craspedostauros australis TaxID=1486917 RepID=A0A7R9ZNE1_9STRA|mmetsp:Transcript_23854/g.66639  ORF Transcript_23854/g.66639 Transcript_23854/m.66639 type:complete len:353 (+) Transcript_23854:556-1614(+)
MDGCMHASFQQNTCASTKQGKAPGPQNSRSAKCSVFFHCTCIRNLWSHPDARLCSNAGTTAYYMVHSIGALPDCVEYLHACILILALSSLHRHASHSCISPHSFVHHFIDHAIHYSTHRISLRNNRAATMYSKCNPAAAVDTYKQAIALYTDSGRIVQAAKLSKEVATIYETEQIDADGKSYVVLAMEAYEQASQLFEMENSKSQASQCLAKIAELCSAALTPPDYERAAQIYGDMGRRCLDSNLLKFNAKGHFLHSIMCVLARNDAVGAQQALAKFQSLDYTFADSREGKFAAQIVECVDGMDVEGFATACFEFDRITKLDPWKTSVLNNIRQLIADDDGGDDDDDDVDLT